jgi:chemotaxis receptor (MCP) glutamine deamidase CheD
MEEDAMHPDPRRQETQIWGSAPTSPALSTLSRHRISIGEIWASAQPGLVKTLLGSCVAVCLHDPVARIGGMNHILLPAAEDGRKAARFGVHAMELLINALMQLGADRHGLVAKAFGGANVLACLRPPTVGDKNVQFVRCFLEAERIPLRAQRLGGLDPVEVRFRSDTGQAFVHSVNGLPLSNLLVGEEHLGQSSWAQRASQTPVLF